MALVFTPQAPPSPYVSLGKGVSDFSKELPSLAAKAIYTIPEAAAATGILAQLFSQVGSNPAAMARLGERGDDEPVYFTVSLSSQEPKAILEFFV